MEGGLRAWDGLAATGGPDAGMARFPEQAPVEELVALAWSLEEGSRKFYVELQALLTDREAVELQALLTDREAVELQALLTDREAVELFQDLVIAEEHHRSALLDLHRKLTNRAAGAFFPGLGNSEDVMEGGMRISDALNWAKGKKLTDVLDLAIGLETNSYDLYIKMGQRSADAQTKELFTLLSAAEQEHLERLAGLLDKKL